MKKFSFLALAAVGLLFAACSSDKDVANEPTPIGEDGNQFIALNINLPVDNSFATRNTTVTDDNNYEDGNFELNDGMESEYTVKDATLVVFHPAATESAATFVAAYDINPEPWKTSTDYQVTDYSTKIVQKVGTTVQAGDLALVILNRNDLIGFKADGTFQVSVDGVLTDFGTSKTFGDLQSSIAHAAGSGQTAAAEMITTGFYMANAPLTDIAGSKTSEPTGAKTQTLVEIKNVYETEAAARAGECAEIYVERGMAKVTLSSTITTPKLGTQYGDGVEGVTPADLSLTIDGWVLDHTNESSFFVRSVEGHSDFIGLINEDANKYRYIGMSPITEGSPTTYKYRSYFAKDTNYEEATYPTVFGNKMTGLTYIPDITAAGVLSDKFGETNPQYCFENTFDVAHQSVNNTTLVRLQVTVGTGDDLYIINGNNSTIYKGDDVIALLQKKCVELYAASGVTTSGTVVGTDFAITLSARDADGYKNVSAIDPSLAAAKVLSGTAPTASELLAAVKLLYKDNTLGKKNGGILCYEDGVSYYTIRIKHFGDVLTPWKKSGSAITPVPSLTAGSYPDWNSSTPADKAACYKNYLGRYGVLRNNWYDLKVSSIKYLGEAVPADYSNDPTPDDEIEGYIAVKINILSWAKRTQAWDL